VINGINISFLGDIFLGGNPSVELSPEIQKILASSDIVIANQEGPISNRETAIGGKCCLKSAPQTAQILRSWGIDVVSLANNHMFDYGWEGFEQTRNYVDKAGIRYLGAGKDLAEASKPLIVDIRGTKVGLLSYSWQFVQTTCATQQSYGSAPLEIKLMTSQIQQLSRQVDAVIVLPHWGYCEYMIPTPEQVDMAKTLIDAGATAVVGHHSHVVQGVIEKNGTLTAFSLGNFAFADYEYGGQTIRSKKENLSGAILKLVLKSRQVVSHQLIHTKQEQNVIVRDDSQQRRKKFEGRLHLPASADYPKYWRCYVRLRLLRRILYWANIMNWRYMHKDTLTGAFLMFRGLFRPTAKR
jgi:poly-gamma-glutamate synthesis protein (capsule biosynthesis protein)